MTEHRPSRCQPRPKYAAVPDNQDDSNSGNESSDVSEYDSQSSTNNDELQLSAHDNNDDASRGEQACSDEVINDLEASSDEDMDVNAEEEMAEHERITGGKTIAAGGGDAEGDNNKDNSVVFLEVRGGKND